jgi:hypothetical protein
MIGLNLNSNPCFGGKTNIMNRVYVYNETEEIDSWGLEGDNTIDLKTTPKILN